jgi:P4 family phage/plasmid primase-like protien
MSNVIKISALSELNGFAGEKSNVPTEKANEYKSISQLIESLTEDQRKFLSNSSNDALTGLYNSECFRVLYGHECIAVKDEFGKPKYWLIWNGNCWRAEYTEVYRRAELTFKMRASLLATKESAIKRLYSSMRNKGIEDSLVNAAHHLSIPESDLNKGNLLPLRNKTIDLDTLEIHEPRPSDYLTFTLDFDYNPEAKSPEYEKFISEVACGDAELARGLQIAQGYSLTNCTKEQKLFLCHGHGANGKSVFLNIAEKIMKPYAKRLDGKVFESSYKDDKNRAIVELIGKRLVIASESRKGAKLKTQLIKNMTGGEALTGSKMREHSVDFDPEFKVWFAFNHFPNLDDLSHAMQRRVTVIPFEATFKSPDELQKGEKFGEDNVFLKDGKLEEKLLKNKAGILNFMLEGLRLYKQQDGLTLNTLERVKKANKDYFAANDSVKQFIDECCITNALKPECTQVSRLKEAYQEFCRDFELLPVNGKEFKIKMEEFGHESTIKAGNKAIYNGIKLKSDGEQERMNLS